MINDNENNGEGKDNYGFSDAWKAIFDTSAARFTAAASWLVAKHGLPVKISTNSAHYDSNEVRAVLSYWINDSNKQMNK